MYGAGRVWRKRIHASNGNARHCKPKSAYDVDPEIMNKIQEFEKKWYKKNDISINVDRISKEIHEEAKRACDGLDEYCETLEDSYVCRKHILRILDIIENLTKGSEKKGE